MRARRGRPSGTEAGPAGRSARARQLDDSLAARDIQLQLNLVKLHAAGEHTIAELAELFEVSRPRLYRVIERRRAHEAADDPLAF